MKSRMYKRKYNYTKTKNGNKFWFKNGLYHREKDLPAIIWSNGDMDWCRVLSL